jgi:hypothetical protein
MTIPTKQLTAADPDIMESVIAKGDLAKLTPAERTEYYLQTCRSMGLNALTQPFSYITLNGRLTLYANRTCADQLRKVNGISLEIVSREVADGILTIHIRAKTPDGRVDEDLGAVPFPDTLKGEMRANMELKAVTKAKRRATLSICGLGWLDETEVEDIPAEAKRLNPHVTRPEDLRGSETPVEYGVDGQPKDNIPLGDPDIRPLPRKKDYRQPGGPYENLQKEMYKIATPEALLSWGVNIKNEVARFQEDDQAIFRDLFKTQLESLRRKAQQEKEEYDNYLVAQGQGERP